MTTLTASGIRTALTNRNSDLVAKMSISNTELDEAAQTGFRTLFPALYKRTRTASLTHSSGELTVTDVNHLYELTTVIDGVTYLVDFELLDETTVGVAPTIETTIAAKYIAPYAWHTSDSITFPDQWVEALYLASEIAMLEQVASERVKFRGYQPNEAAAVDENEILNLIDRKRDRLAAEMDEKRMLLPSMVVC